jgi:hypothetical protein
MPPCKQAPALLLTIDTAAAATSQASVAFGLKILAKSNVVLLTIPWVIALLFGRRPLTAVQKGASGRDRLQSSPEVDDLISNTRTCAAKDTSPGMVAQCVAILLSKYRHQRADSLDSCPLI